jgi:serine-type D-Ala-D-Ala carboxypeptidase/endopeptidase (penicillin-binding protein 4)
VKRFAAALVVFAACALTRATSPAVAQVGLGSPTVSVVDGGVPPDTAVTTTIVSAGPVPVVGAATTTVVVAAGPTTPVPPVATTTTPTATSIPASLPTPTSTKPAARPPATTVAELRARIDAALGTSSAGSIGVLVIGDGDTSIFERNADTALIPASTQKLYVAGAALAMMGSEARYQTEVFANGAVAANVLRGDLIIRPSGDPSFGSTQLASLAASVRAAGIASVTGSLVLDDARYDRAVRVASWKAKFTPGESGWLSAFAVDGNHRADAATVADPGLANLARFRAALLSKGVTVDGIDTRGAAGPSTRSIASVTSAPLADLVSSFVKRSDNTYAELLTKELGARTATGSTADGVRAIGSYFDQLAVTRPQAQEDGSGLSANNRSSARVQVKFLQRALAGPNGPALRRSLAITCVDGTLKSRTCGTPAAGKVFAKSGSIDNVVALTGVTATASGRPVTFAFLLNNVRSARLGRVAIDAALNEIVSSSI